MGVTDTGDKSLSERIGLLVAWGLMLVRGVVYGIWYWRRRTTTILVARGPHLTQFLQACVWLTQGVLLGDLIQPHFMCSDGTGILYPLTLLGFFGIISLGFYRCLLLITRFESQRVRLSMKLAEEGFVMPSEKNIFQTHLKFLSGNGPLVLLVAYSVIFPLYRLIVPLSQSQLCEGKMTEPAVTAMEAAVVLGILFLAYQIRTVTESLGIVRELAGQGVCAILHLAVIGMRAFMFGGDSNVIYHIELIVVETALWYITFHVPIRLSYQTERAAQQRSKTSILSIPIPPQLATFSGLMASKPGRLSFRQHLQTEFSVENLFFVDDVDAFRLWHDTTKASLSSPPHNAPDAAANTEEPESDPARSAFAVDARTRALALYQRYIAAAAPFEINLSSHNKKELHAQFRVKAPKNGRGGGPAGPNAAAASAGGGIAITAAAAARPNSQSGSGTARRYQQTVVVAAKRVSRSDQKSAAQPQAAADASPAVATATGPVIVGSVTPLWSGATALTVPNPNPNADHESKSAAAGNATPIVGPRPALLSTLPPPPTGTARAAHTPSETPVSVPPPAARAGAPPEIGITLSPIHETRDAAFYVHLFDAAHAEVYHLLVTDSYVRYVHSSLFEKLVQQQTLANELADAPLPSAIEIALPTSGTSGGGAGGKFAGFGTATGALSRGANHSVSTIGVSKMLPPLSAGGVSRSGAPPPLTAGARASSVVLPAKPGSASNQILE